MSDVFTWITTHWSTVLQCIADAIAIASIIVKWTPTIKDNEVLLAIIKFLGKYVALNRTVDDNAIRKENPKG